MQSKTKNRQKQWKTFFLLVRFKRALSLTLHHFGLETQILRTVFFKCLAIQIVGLCSIWNFYNFLWQEIQKALFIMRCFEKSDSYVKLYFSWVEYTIKIYLLLLRLLQALSWCDRKLEKAWLVHRLDDVSRQTLAFLPSCRACSSADRGGLESRPSVRRRGLVRDNHPAVLLDPLLLLFLLLPLVRREKVGWIKSHRTESM